MEALSSESQTDTDRDVAPAVELTSKIVAAFVSHNSVGIGDLSALIRSVYGALTAVPGSTTAPAEVEKPVPFVPIRKSVTPDYIVCLEDGRQMKMLKHHLKRSYGLSPDAYRAKWGLPPDYPMVAPNYAARRSSLAKSSGLGRRRPDALDHED